MKRYLHGNCQTLVVRTLSFPKLKGLESNVFGSMDLQIEGAKSMEVLRLTMYNRILTVCPIE